MKLGRLLLRLSVGGFFVGHGTQKLFGWFGGHGLDATAAGFEQLGLRPGRRHAIAAGAAEAGGKSIGLSIELPHEQWPNGYINPELSFMFHYFFMRKLWFAQLAKALIVFPGGFGTMDELWEMLTLMQTGKLQRRNIILIYGRSYWDKVLNWKHMLRSGTINEKEFHLLEFADTVDQAFDRIRQGLEMYHMTPDTLLSE